MTMPKRKETRKYYFTVEGETEQWYLKWLEALINRTEAAAYRVSFDCPVQGYRYYRENPSLAIWEIIKQIMVECGLIRA